MPVDLDDILARWRKLSNSRQQWLNHWQSLADIFLPSRADFTTQQVAGARRTSRIYDGTTLMARRNLTSAIGGTLKPREERWFNIRTSDEQLNRINDARLWFAEVEDRMYTAIYNPDARFLQRTGEVDDDLITFGTGALFMGLRSDLGGLMFQSIHLRDLTIAENADGQIDTHMIRRMWSPRQAIQRFGRERVHEEVLRLAEKPETLDIEREYLWLVRPREDRDPRRRDNLNAEWESVIIDVVLHHVVAESGFRENPFAIPRWDTTSDEVYGRSPAMLALPDGNTLQSQAKTLLVGGQRAVDPPWWLAADGIVGTARLVPGGYTYVDAAKTAQLGGPPLGQFENRGNIPLGRDMQEDSRNNVFRAFFRDILTLPVDRPEMTATEVLARREEFLRVIGPVFGRLEADYIGRIPERVFWLMFRAGAFPPPPRELSDAQANIEFEYRSPVTQARKQRDAAGIQQWLGLTGPFIELDPTLIDNFDLDSVVRESAEAFGFRPQWLRDPRQVQAIRQGRIEQQQQAAQLDQLVQGAEAAERIGRAAGQAAPLLTDQRRSQ